MSALPPPSPRPSPRAGEMCGEVGGARGEGEGARLPWGVIPADLGGRIVPCSVPRRGRAHEASSA